MIRYKTFSKNLIYDILRRKLYLREHLISLSSICDFINYPFILVNSKQYGVQFFIIFQLCYECFPFKMKFLLINSCKS